MTDESLENRLRLFLAECAAVPPPAGLTTVPDLAGGGRRGRIVRFVAASAVVIAVAVAAVVLLADRAARAHPPTGGPAIPGPSSSSTPGGPAPLHIDSIAGQGQCLAYMGRYPSPREYLEAEYDMTAGEVNAWDHSILPGAEAISYPLRGLPAGAPIAFCFIHGDYPIPGPVPGSPVPDRMEVAIDAQGTAYTMTYGFSSVYPARPAAH